MERMVLRGKVVPVPVLLVIVAAPGGGSNPWHAAGVHEGTVRYEKGNPDLRPEFSLQGDLGADFSNKYLSASAALFCNRIQNYIFASRTADVTEGHPVYQYSADNALLYGGELSLDIHPVHRLHLNSQFSFVRGTFGQENMPLIPAPRLSGEIK